MKIWLLFSVGFTAMSGCATSHVNPKSNAQPFAILYGAKEAQWLSGNQKAIFLGKYDSVDFLETEISGFKQLDSNNQKLYLVIRFCTHQSANAEDGSQMWILMSNLKCSKRELSQYFRSLDRKALALYASYLRGSIELFDRNFLNYLQ